MTIPSQCLACGRFWGLTKCDAYTTEIPEQIATNEHDHTKPYEGDNGIRFTPLPKE